MILVVKLFLVQLQFDCGCKHIFMMAIGRILVQLRLSIMQTWESLKSQCQILASMIVRLQYILNHVCLMLMLQTVLLERVVSSRTAKSIILLLDFALAFLKVL